MMNYTQRKNYISSFLVALSIQIKSNFFENKVVLDVVLNDLIRCGNEHVIWNSIINEKDWITTFNDISVSLVNEKEIEMLERSQKVFARLIGFAFTTTTYISLETFFIIFRSLLNHIVFDVLSTLSTETLANIIPQLLLLFSYFFCKCNSYGCDSSLPFFQNDFKLISKCLDHYIPQSKPCDSQVSSMQHVFSVHLILCHLHSLTLNKSPVQLIRKTIQLLPPYFVEKPSYQGYNSWVIFHLKDIVEESADSNVRRDVANMLHLLDSSRKIPTTLDYKGIQTFGKLIETLYTTHQNGLKMQSDCVDVESKKSKPLFKSTFHQIQIPNIGVAQMDYPRLIISETDFILRISTSTKKNYNMSLRSNPLFKIKQEPFQAFSGISFSDIKPFDPVKGFDEEYEQVSKKSKGLVDFMTLPHDQSFDCVIMKCAKRKIAKVYINPNNLQLCIKTQNKMIEFDLHLLETVIKRKQDIFELYVKMKHPIMFFFKDGTKFMTTLTHTIESHAIPTTVITDLQKTISSSIVSKEWSMGRVSNYSYLHFLNIFNGKSFNSLNSHPIFPWLDSSVNWETFIPHITNQNCHTSITTIPSPKPTIREFSKLSATQVCCTLHNYEPFQSLLPYYQAQTMSGKAIRSIDQNSKHGLPSEVYLYPLLCSLDRFYILRMSLESKFLNTELLEWVKRAFPHIKKKIGDNNVYGLVNDSNDGLIEIETTSEKTIIKHKGNSMEIGGYLLCFEDSGKGSVEVIVGNNTGIDWMKVDNDYLFSVMKIEEINKIGNVQIIPKHGVIIFTSNGFYFKTISGNVAYEYNKIPSIFHASASGFSYFIEDSLLHVITMYENHFQCSVDENIISMTTVTCLFLDFIILAKSDEIQTFVFLGDRLLPLTTIPFKNGKIIKVCSNTLEMEDPSNWNFVVCFEKDGVNTFSVYSLQYITLVNQ
ncbi:BEACH domain-containing protein [Entamoeba marina]